ncbi:alpha/beta fold hydrolase [Micromonospora sp. BQ11]|uniref:alpha/beta fold hydrolase n=1 Tax=Micromonospora sp. BQ11 TaxID=3452212 RepID=UPI003F8BC75E
MEEFGRGNTPCVVLLHGAATSGWMWRGLAASLAEDLHVLVPDLPGHGRSNTRPWVSVADTVAAMADVIRSRSPRGRAHVVGLSLGGTIVVQLAASVPDVVESAIVSGVNVLPYPNPVLMRLAGLVMAPLVTSGPMLRATARGLGVPAEDFDGFRASAKAMAPGTFRRVGAELMTFGVPEAAGSSPCRLLAVAGGNEHELIRRSLPELANGFAHGQARLAPGVGHGWSGEAPDLFAAMVRAHLAGVALPDELRPAPGTARS